MIELNIENGDVTETVERLQTLRFLVVFGNNEDGAVVGYGFEAEPTDDDIIEARKNAAMKVDLMRYQMAVIDIKKGENIPDDINEAIKFYDDTYHRLVDMYTNDKMSEKDFVVSCQHLAGSLVRKFGSAFNVCKDPACYRCRMLEKAMEIHELMTAPINGTVH